MRETLRKLFCPYTGFLAAASVSLLGAALSGGGADAAPQQAAYAVLRNAARTAAQETAAKSPQEAAPAGKTPDASPIRHVIIVSVDGLMPASYITPDEHGLKVATLRELVRHGAWSEGARSVFPTVTFPSHTSMATGVNPARHGVVTNLAPDPFGKNSSGWRWYTEDIRVPTLWEAASAKGLRTALVCWPVTVGAHASAIVPEYWRAGTPDDVKLLRVLATPGLLEAVRKEFPDFREGFTPPHTKDEAVTDIAVHLLETLRPNLLMMHIIEVDHWEHEKGPFSPEAKEAIEGADRQIARLIAAAKKAGIWSETALVVVSDHGFVPISKRVRPGVWLREKGLITLDERNHVTAWKAVLLSDGGSAYLYVKDRDDEATRKALLKLFERVAGKRDSGIRRILTREQIAALGGDPEAALALEAAEGYGIADGYTGDVISPSTVKGTHGYSPELPEMRASLLIYGPAIGAGKIEGARLIDVAPTVARWLDLELEGTEGAALGLPRPPDR